MWFECRIEPFDIFLQSYYVYQALLISQTYKKLIEPILTLHDWLKRCTPNDIADELQGRYYNYLYEYKFVEEWNESR